MNWCKLLIFNLIIIKVIFYDIVDWSWFFDFSAVKKLCQLVWTKRILNNVNWNYEYPQKDNYNISQYKRSNLYMKKKVLH